MQRISLRDSRPPCDALASEPIYRMVVFHRQTLSDAVVWCLQGLAPRLWIKLSGRKLPSSRKIAPNTSRNRRESRTKILSRMQLLCTVERPAKRAVYLAGPRGSPPFRRRFRRRIATADLQKRGNRRAEIVQAQREQRGREFAVE